MKNLEDMNKAELESEVSRLEILARLQVEEDTKASLRHKIRSMRRGLLLNPETGERA